MLFIFKVKMFIKKINKQFLTFFKHRWKFEINPLQEKEIKIFKIA